MYKNKSILKLLLTIDYLNYQPIFNQSINYKINYKNLGAKTHEKKKKKTNVPILLIQTLIKLRLF